MIHQKYNLRECLTDIRSGWPEYKKKVKVSKQEPVYELVQEVLPSVLHQAIDSDYSYIIEGSTGKGIITAAPWCATLDRRITESASSGFYLVYLFSTDLSKVYLSIAFGITDFTKQFGTGVLCERKLRDAAEKLQIATPLNRTLITSNIELKADFGNHRKFEYSNIFAIDYDFKNLPSNEILLDDYSFMLDLYSKIYLNLSIPSVLDLVDEIGKDVSLPQPITRLFAPRLKRTRGGSIEKVGSSRQRISRESKVIGDKGEKLVLEYEKKDLHKANRSDLAAKVRWVAAEGEKPGYDIQSFEPNGHKKLIEVKTTTSDRIDSFELTANELSASKRYGDEYWIYLVSSVNKKEPTIEIIHSSDLYHDNHDIQIEPIRFRVNL